jgi:hypothetical protein
MYPTRCTSGAGVPTRGTSHWGHPLRVERAVATTTCMSRLSEFSCPSDAPIHGLADRPPRLLLTDIGCGTLASRSQTRHTQHHNFGYTNTLTAEKLRTCISWLLSPDGAHLHAHRPLRCTTSNGYWVWHPAPRSQTTHGNTHCLRLKPRQ